MTLPGGALGMGFCRIRILFDRNLAFLERDVFSSRIQEFMTAVPIGEKLASLQVVGAECLVNI